MREDARKERFSCRLGWAKGNSLPLHGNFPGVELAEEPARHWPDVIWPVHMTEGSIRENSRFHGEKLAFTGPQNTCRYPLSFFRFGSLRRRDRRTRFRAGDAAQAGAYV